MLGLKQLHYGASLTAAFVNQKYFWNPNTSAQLTPPTTLVFRDTPLERAKKIRHEVCERYGITPAQINSDNRSKKLVIPRHELAYRLRNELLWSAPVIGGFMRRDHTTILYAIETHAKRIFAPTIVPPTEAYYGA